MLAQAALPAIDLPMPAQGVAVDPTTNRLYVSVSPPIWAVDADTHAVLARYDEMMARMGPVAVNPLTNRVYTGMVSGAGRTNTTLATVPVGARPFFVATNPITNRVYVASNDPDGPMLTIVDGAADTVVSRLPLPGRPVQLAVNAQTNRVYVAVSGVPALQVFEDSPSAPPP